MLKMQIRPLIISLALLFPALIYAVDISGSINDDSIWNTSESPYYVRGIVTVSAGVTLTVQPGVEILFGEKAGIIVNGFLVARGTAADSIRLTSMERNEPGAWGGVMISGATEQPSWDADGEYTGTGSILEYCVLEYAGDENIALGSALVIETSSPLLKNSSIRFCQGETGAIKCGNLSKAFIVNCSITGNTASRGGAISLGVGSKSVLRSNTIALNNAEDNGGAVYCSLGDAEISGNSFLGNRAKAHGGAIYAAGPANLVIEGNVFINNESAYGSPAVYFTKQVQCEMHQNAFMGSGCMVFLQGATYDLNAAENWWGKPGEYIFKGAFRDKRVDPSEPFVQYRPFLWAPPQDLLTNPAGVKSIQLCRDDSYSEEIPFGVADGAPLRVRLDGIDSDPYMPDMIHVRVVSTLDPKGIILPLVETSASSGIFTGRSGVALISSQEDYIIGDEIGGQVTIFAPFAPETRVEYATMSPKPFAEKLTIDDIPPLLTSPPITGGDKVGGIIDAGDILHVTNHSPRFSWNYFEVVERPQTHYRLGVFPVSADGSPQESPIWDTGEFASVETKSDYSGAPLQDGMTYLARLAVHSGYLWSDPVELTLRMNSLPSAPEPVMPVENELAGTKTPSLVTGISTDPESDELTYTFEIHDFSRRDKVIQSGSGITPSAGRVTWKPTEALAENSGYTYRAKAVDPYEEGPWSQPRTFWINSLEENPAQFDLGSPVAGVTIYDLHPILGWERAVDPDPLSNVTYAIEVSKNESFAPAFTYTGVFPTGFTVPDSLDNRALYFWRVTAVDNTNRSTKSASVGKFYVDTTPSVPVSIAPLAGEERLPAAALTWEISSDPDPGDLIIYDVQVLDSPQGGNVVATVSGWESTSLPVEELDNWENLVDNRIYYWRVRSRDNHNADSPFGAVGSFFYNRYNDNPAPVATITSPLEKVTGSTLVSFAWESVSDPDLSDTPQTLVCEIQAVLGDFDTGNIRYFVSAPGSLELSANLDDNRLWHYRIRVKDDEGAVSSWSEVGKVLVNAAEDPPEPFALNMPDNNRQIVELDSLLFTWQATNDPDWESSVNYRLEVFPETGDPFRFDLRYTQYDFREGLVNASRYRWSVTAIDNTGLTTAARSEFSFTTNTTPTTPTAAPLPDELLPGDQLAFNSATDPNPRDMLEYTIEIAGDISFASPVIHMEGFAHEVGTITTVISSLDGYDTLADDTDYYFRIRAVDNHGYAGSYSEPAKFRFNRENDAPGAPGAPFAPAGRSVVRTQSPEVSWTQANDADLSDPPQRLAYNIRLDSDGELENTVLYDFTTPPGVSSFVIPAPLADNMPWVWQIRTRDDEGAVSPWSPVQEILVNVTEDAPTPPALINPYPGQMMNVLGPVEFKWSQSIDPDYQSAVTYRVQYSKSANFDAADELPGSAVTSAKVDGPLENTVYHWRVIVTDNTGLETFSAPGMFTLNTRPSVPQPSLPQGRMEILPNGILKWNPSVDPNPADKITYTVQLGTGPASDLAGSSSTLVKSEISGTSANLSQLGWNAAEVIASYGDNKVCSWRVKAVDNHSIASEWSPAAEFTFNGRNDAPLAVSVLNNPADGAEIPAVNLIWQPASDPDISDTPDKISYRIELAKDAGFTDDLRSLQTASGVNALSPSGLTDNTKWHWRVIAVDDEGASGPASLSRSFIYNSRNDAPSEFTLVSPETGATVQPSDCSFRWNASTDPDPNDKLTYTLVIARDAAFTTDLKSHREIQGTQFTIPAPDLTVEGTYFWRVTAEDGKGGTAWSRTEGQARSFILKLPQPPTQAPTPGG